MNLVQRQRQAAIAGGAGLALCGIGACFAPAAVWQAYWFAWVFWVMLSLGFLAVLLLRHLVRSQWGEVMQRPAEAGALTLGLMAVLMVPAWFGLGHIFGWARPGGIAAHAPHKQAYLQVGWFILRAVGYFAILGGLAWRLRHRAGRGWSGAGAVVFFFCLEFASTDWVLSLEPQWYSSMFVIIFVISAFLSALAFGIAGLAWRSDAGQFTPKLWHDLGNLLFAFVIFWAYVEFSQFLLIWAGNLPREISWYLHRSAGGWKTLAGLLALFLFAMPFVLLLLRVTKRHRVALGPIAAAVWLVGVVNLYWHLAPSWHARVHFPGWELVALVGIGGLWLSAFFHFLQQRPLLEVPHA